MIKRHLLGYTLLATLGAATASTAAQAACIANASTVEARDAFKADPASLLRRHPFGSGGLVGEVRNFVVSDSTLIPVTISLVPSANPRQKSAIAGGLAQAARACAISEQKTALDIQQAVAGLPDAEIQTAFAVATGETLTTAVGPGAASGPGAAGASGGGTAGSGSGGGGTQSIERSTPRSVSAFSFSGGGGSLLVPTQTNTISAQALDAATPTSVAGR